MGFSSVFYCDHCGYRETILYGSGMMFPQTYKTVLSAVKAGDYGEEMKKVSRSITGVAVDAEKYLYICPDCGTWKSDFGLTLYAPDDPAYGKQEYVMLYELKDHYHMERRYFHKCESCGKRMRRYQEGDRPVCPKCHDIGRIECDGLWD